MEKDIEDIKRALVLSHSGNVKDVFEHDRLIDKFRKQLGLK